MKCHNCENMISLTLDTGGFIAFCSIQDRYEINRIHGCSHFSSKPKEKLSDKQKVKNRIVLAEGKKPRKGSQRTEAYKLSRVKVMKYMGKVPKV